MPPASGLTVSHPQQMVALTRAEIHALLDEPPPTPAEDAGVEWATVTRTLEHLADQLASPPSFRRGFGFTATLPAPVTDRERVIVEIWLQPGLAPTLDVVAGTIDGKGDWLAAVLDRTDGPVPIRLSLFDEIREIDRLSDTFRARVREQAAATLSRLGADALWRSPLAVAVLRQLATESAERRPDAPRQARSRSLFRRPTAS